ncbi:MAG: MFS transporter [Alphaproteobacteria bacterium]|nr:MFS transporter [Alphaproteobacteria bacterium]
MFGAIPVAPLIATLMLQTLATMAAYSLPAAAPAVARDLGVDGALIGFFISIVYGVGIVSAVLSPGFIHRFGAVRVSQAVMLATLAMLLTAASGGVLALALSAVLLGTAYGATAPVSTHLLVPRTPRHVINLVLSIRQIGVPLGGVLGGLLVPPLVLAFGWRPALLVQLAPALALLLVLQLARQAWDAERDPGRCIFHRGILRPLALLRQDAGIRRLSVSCFLYSGIQLCFIAFMTVHLTGVAQQELIQAGRALATYQIAGVVSRPIWGWLADRHLPATRLLTLQGAIMALAALAAGQFGPDWPFWLILLVCAVAGATASGFTGIAYAEYARRGGERRTEATGLGAGAMFAGVLVLPSAFGLMVTLRDDFTLAYGALALLAALGGLLLAADKGR